MKIIHTSNHPVMALQSIRPLAEKCREAKIDTEVWVQVKRSEIKYRSLFPSYFKEIMTDISLNPVISIVRIYNYYRQIKKSKADVLHAHACRSSLIPLLAAYLANVRVRIYHNHGMPYLGYKGIIRFVLKMIERWNIFFSNRMICVSRGNLSEAIKDGLLSKGYCRIIHNGSAVGMNHFDVDKMKLRKQWDIPDKSIVFGYIGRPHVRKGFHLMIKAWNKSLLAKQGHCLLIAGPDSDDCRRVSSDLDGVRAHGFIEAIDHFIGACDVVCLPSFHEGLPNVFLEGAAMAKALIGSDIPGTEDIIQDGVNGIVIDPGDENDLVTKLRYLVENPQKIEDMGIQGQKIVNQLYNREDVLNAYIKYYEEIGS